MKTAPGLLLLSAVLTLTTCDLINPAEGIPSYVQLESVDLITTSQQGSDNHKISEVWVFDGGKMLGAYEVPGFVPVLKEGDVDFSLRAGIKNNGIANSRIMYPMFKPLDMNLPLKALDTVAVTLVYEYKDNVEFIKEGFEDAGFALEGVNGSQVVMETIDHPDSVFEGNGAGFVSIPGDFTYWQARWQNEMLLPAGEQMWLELDYKCNNNFAAGLYAFSGTEEIKSLTIILNPTTDESGVAQWNKIYIELTETAATYLTADHFALYFECSKQSDVGTAEIWLDNIKVVHFE
jgi:hypothetical protein